MTPTPFYVRPIGVTVVQVNPSLAMLTDPNDAKIYKLTTTILKQHPELPVSSCLDVKQILVNERISYEAMSIDELLPFVVKKIKYFQDRKPESTLLFDMYKRLPMGTSAEKVYMQVKENLHYFSKEEAISFISDIQNQEIAKLRSYLEANLYLTPSQLLRCRAAMRFSARVKIREFLAQMREDLIDEFVLTMSSTKKKDYSSKTITLELHNKVMDRVIKKDRDMHNITETIRKEALESARTFLQQATSQEIKQLLSEDLSNQEFQKISSFNKSLHETLLIKLLTQKALKDIFQHLKSLSGAKLLKYFSPLEFLSEKNIRKAVSDVSKFFKKKSNTAKNNAYMNRYFHTWQSTSIIIRAIQSNPDLSDEEIEKQLPPLKLIERDEDRLSWIENIRSTLEKFQEGSQGVFDSLFEASIERDLASLLNKA
ncbi:MAG: hypothetical protein COT84_00945 [Chlamydiae bacterium CG10_big_fil_rev_8_21_14_0_10_35_9]|nr:MAG: hypothetical protein COT84_00945 [Chlamydiae bacterium CG10_big_fil_rev_8_21_14_0_10_35_9]